MKILWQGLGGLSILVSLVAVVASPPLAQYIATLAVAFLLLGVISELEHGKTVSNSTGKDN